MSSVSEEGPRSTSARVVSFIRGPRFVDLPIRLLALIMGLTVLIPGSFEIDEPRYVMLIVFAYALFLVAPFLPLATGLISTGLSLAFVALYPDLENMFPEVLIFATAVLLSHRRWIGAAIATLGLAAYLVTSTGLVAYDGGVEGFIDLGFGWLTYSLIGLAAGLVELRIQREIIRREQAAVEHQKTVEVMRSRFTSDMHDTLSNSLATESAIIRTMARTTGSPESERLLAELALVNAEATKRLRHLVAGLRSGETQGRRIRLHTETRQLAASIESGCSAGSVLLATHVAELPKYASVALGQNFRAILLELATNVIRYSTPGTRSTLEVEMRQATSGQAELICRTTNSAQTELAQTPRSLSRRAGAVNGTCRVIPDEDGRVIVEVVLPVRYVSGAEEIDVLCDRNDPTRLDSADADGEVTSARSEIAGTATGSAVSNGAVSNGPAKDGAAKDGAGKHRAGSGPSHSEHTAGRKNRVEA